MGIDVVVENAQRAEPVALDRWRELATAVLRAEGIAGPAELTVRFVDEEEIATLNGGFLGHEGPTDVLSFPIEDDPRAPRPPGAPPVLLGDIVICPSVAARNAPLHDATYSDECALLLVHGILHLLGMDHVVDAEAEAMEARERSHLAAFAALAPDGT
jgi:probable rRNA maturation factor